MNGGEVLQAARAAGVDVRLDGVDLVLEASTPPPPALLDLLVHNKALIVAMLRRDKLAPSVARTLRPCLDEIVERSAAIGKKIGLNGRIAVDRQARSEANSLSLEAYSITPRIEIDAALNDLPPACDRSGQRLLAATRAFLQSYWFLQAIKCGWMLEELFGVDAHSPLERCDQWGLVVGLAWAPQRDDMIGRIDDECAVICFRDGAGLREKRRIERRFSPEADTVLWWRCFNLVSDVE